MSTLTWITVKQLEREIKNKGNEFTWKENMKNEKYAAVKKKAHRKPYDIPSIKRV